MTGRRNPPLRRTLPDEINPPKRLCFEVEVPDNKYHIAAFRGAILSLASAIGWQNDMAHTAKEVALVWRDVYDKIKLCQGENINLGIDIEESEMNLRVDPDNPCIIQAWCIDHWEEWFNASNCAPSAVAQPSGEGEITVGTCKEWNVVLRGNDRWLLPVPVQGDYTIEVTEASGGWNDGTPEWFCANGFTYILGACTTGSGGTEGDPRPDLDHMRLLASIDGTFYDAIDNLIAVPSSVEDGTVEFQANDETLSDNGGSISFKVRVCANSAGQQVSIFSTTTSAICNRGLLSKGVVGVGDTFTFTLADQEGCPNTVLFDGIFRASDHLTLKIISVTNWTDSGDWQWFDPDNGFSGEPDIDAQQSTLGWAGNSHTQATIGFQVVSIP